MSFSHLTLPTRDVERTASFFQATLGYGRKTPPDNSPTATQWLDLGHGQDLHIVHVEGFEASPFEGEFGRHVAVYVPAEDFPVLRQRLVEAGAVIMEPQRATPHQRLFFREPVNGYVFEVIEKRVAR